MKVTVELMDAAFILRVGDEAQQRVDADFVLRFRMPDGVTQEWNFGFNHQGIRDWPRDGFEFFARSLFDDHVYDMAMADLVPDRGFDALTVRYEVPDRVRAILRS